MKATGGDEMVPDRVSITFGSGTILSMVATDLVTLGNITVNMSKSLLLMTDDSQLMIEGPFEGILGLGIPGSKIMEGKLRESLLVTRDGQNTVMEEQREILAQVSGKRRPSLFAGLVKRIFDEHSYLEQAGAQRFSLCFNDGHGGGALRVEPQTPTKPLSAVGKEHWSLGLSSVQVDDLALNFCNPEQMRNGQKTPCAFIPDSGTTMIMGPEPQIMAIYAGLCSRWPRCRALLQSEQTHHKAFVFTELLKNCSQWLHQSANGLYELPEIHFEVTGANNATHDIKLSAWAYVFEGFEQNRKHKDGHWEKICRPAFIPLDYVTPDFGDVWIMGTPLFYEFEVVYDLQSVPPTMGFNRFKDSTGCAACDEQPSLISAVNNVRNGHQPRKIWGRPRVPSIDVRRPL